MDEYQNNYTEWKKPGTLGATGYVHYFIAEIFFFMGVYYILWTCAVYCMPPI